MMDKKKIKVCADIFPPYQYRQEDGTDTGLDYDVVIGTLQKAGYETEFFLGLWDEVSDLFESREADVLFQVQDTPERLEKYYLSDKLRDAETEVVVSGDCKENINCYGDLASLRLGVIEGFANGEEIDALPQDCKRAYGNTEAMLHGLDCGEIDAAVCDRGVKEYVSGNSGQYPAIPCLTYKRPLYVMFHEKDLRDAFNKALSKEVQ